MNEIKDERIRFYLRHQALIKQWSQIEKELPAVCEKFLWSLQEDIERLKDELDANVRLYKEEGGYPKLFLYRDSWRLDSKERAPAVGIGIEWQQNRVGFESGLPYVGIWNNKSSSIIGVLREELAKVIESNKPTAWFLEKNFVAPPPDEDYWENLRPYRERILSEIRKYWARYASGVDVAIEEVRLRLADGNSIVF